MKSLQEFGNNFMDNNLHDLTVSELSSLLEKKEISSVELTKRFLKQIDIKEDSVNAFALITRDNAFEQASESDKRRKENKQSTFSELEGIPYGLKDIFDTKNILTEAGSEIYKGRIPDSDAHVVELLNANGAVLLGKTITTEFADGHPPETKNPWDANRTPGGSSTGSAVAVATRMLPYALGTQTVGSVLRPAAYNGIVGLKPTYGLVSRSGVIPQSDSCDTVGVLCRNVNDAWLIFKSIIGYDSKDKKSLIQAESFDISENLGNFIPKIGFLNKYFMEESDEQVKNSTLSALKSLSNQGATIEELELKIDFESGFQSHRIVQQSEMAQWHEPLYSKYQNKYKPITLEYIKSGFTQNATDYINALGFRNRMRKIFIDSLKSFDVLIMPTASGLPPKDLSRTGDTRFQSPWTFTGLPSIAIPAGLSENGLPQSLQLVSSPYKERKLLNSAKWIESVLGTLPEPEIKEKF
jgi:Asp-tRNA(Asn)/Glu-tRNA(Gln) amidotransferase A subunit family amidase|tara:strand:- start:1470 stop:2873 length:1404 start_codon:yes stop_codon:yes gene_type:complete